MIRAMIFIRDLLFKWHSFLKATFFFTYDLK